MPKSLRPTISLVSIAAAVVVHLNKKLVVEGRHYLTCYSCSLSDSIKNCLTTTTLEQIPGENF